MPGSFGDLDLLQNGSLPHADLVVVHNTTGYQLDFRTLNEDTAVEFDVEEDCSVYGNELVAFQICFRDTKDRISMRKCRPYLTLSPSLLML